MSLREALGIAKAALELQPNKTEQIETAISRIDNILQQRGCEDHDPALKDDGRLTSLMELIIFG